MSPTVSIIVACHNSGKFLQQTISSILDQTLAEWELLLVDDASLDETWSIIERNLSGDQRIKGFRRQNQGTSRTRNYGFSNSDPGTRYLFFLDHDDCLDPSALSVMTRYLDHHPDVGLLACQVKEVDEHGLLLGTGKRSRWVPGFFFPRKLKDEEVETPFVSLFCATGQGPFAMYRRSVFEKTEGWETSFWPHEDTDMFCKMALLASVHFLPNRLYLKRIHSQQGMSDWKRLQKAHGAFRRKWDEIEPRNDRESKLLAHARRHYYSRHRPSRDLKVAAKALGEFVRKPNLKKLCWFMELLTSACKGFFLTNPKHIPGSSIL
jgi:glycosyltransferase involved in cell wall biosynthesis